MAQRSRWDRLDANASADLGEALSKLLVRGRQSLELHLDEGSQHWDLFIHSDGEVLRTIGVGFELDGQFRMLIERLAYVRGETSDIGIVVPLQRAEVIFFLEREGSGVIVGGYSGRDNVSSK